MQGARNAETGMYLKYMRISSAAQRRRRPPQQFLKLRLRELRFGQRRILREIAFDAAEDRIGDFHLMVIIVQAALFAGVADEGGFDQDGWDIRRFQHGETGLLDMAAMQVVDVA